MTIRLDARRTYTIELLIAKMGDRATVLSGPERRD